MLREIHFWLKIINSEWFIFGFIFKYFYNIFFVSPPVLDFARSAIDEKTSARLHKYYKINNGTDSFATVALFKNVFKLGDDITCRLTFDQKPELKCTMVCCFFLPLFYFEAKSYI